MRTVNFIIELQTTNLKALIPGQGIEHQRVTDNDAATTSHSTTTESTQSNEHTALTLTQSDFVNHLFIYHYTLPTSLRPPNAHHHTFRPHD